MHAVTLNTKDNDFTEILTCAFDTVDRIMFLATQDYFNPEYTNHVQNVRKYSLINS